MTTNEGRIRTSIETIHNNVFKNAVQLLGSFFSVFDANSKLQSGILEGHFANLGDFDECINVDSGGSGDNVERIRGKYCLGDYGKVVRKQRFTIKFSHIFIMQEIIVI